MYIRIISDIHLEHRDGKWGKAIKLIQELDTDKETVLCIAGDLSTFHRKEWVQFLKAVSKKFHSVVYVPGNHEFYYNNNFPDTPDVDLPNNVFLLNRNYVVIGNVLFLGTTLWSDLSNPVYGMIAERGMNDYRNIKCTDSNYVLSADRSTEEHNKNVRFIKNVLNLFKEETLKSVIVTHHLPSFSAISEEYKGRNLNYAYASNLDDIILEYKPNLWINGHSHSFYDAIIGETRVIRNPVGYPNERTGYKKDLVAQI